MQKHEVLNREKIKVNFFTVENMTVAHPSKKGKEKVYSIIHHPDWVNVVAETAEGNVILIDQWRAGTDEMSIEVPGGKVDEGEEPIEAGLRELKEETGYTATAESKIAYLGYVEANPAIQNNKMHYVYISNVEKTKDTNFDEFELVYTRVCNKHKVIDMLSSGAIKHAYSVLALHKAFKG